MFRHIEGCKAQHRDITVMVAHNFAEWHVILVKHPATLIQGDRQFSEEKARAHARHLFERYIQEEEHGDVSALPADFTWAPLDEGDWVAWRP